MRSILELISKYKSDVIIIPILAVAALVISFSLYIFFNKKWIKYMPGFIGLPIGLLFLVQGYFELLSDTGLNFVAIGIKFSVFALVSLAFSAIIDLLDGIGANFVKNKKKEEAVKTDEQNKAEIEFKDITSDALDDFAADLSEENSNFAVEDRAGESSLDSTDLEEVRGRDDDTKRFDLKDFRGK